MDTTNNQSIQLDIAQKIIKILELEVKDQKVKFEKIKFQNQTLFKSMDCQQDLIERLKSENKELKLQKQSLAEDLSTVQEIKCKQESEIKELNFSRKNMEMINISNIKDMLKYAGHLEKKLDEANSQIDDLKLRNQNLQDGWFKQESKISDLTNSNLELEKNLKKIIEAQIAASYDLYSKKEEEVLELKGQLDEANFQIIDLKFKNLKLVFEKEQRHYKNEIKRTLEDNKICEEGQKIDNLNMEIVTLTKALEIEKQKQLEWNGEINEYKVEIQIQKDILATSEEICSKKEKKIQELKEELDEKDSQIDDLNLQNHDLKLGNQSLQDDLIKQESKINHLKNSNQEIDNLYDKLAEVYRNVVEDLKQEKLEMTEEINEFKLENQKLKETLAASEKFSSEKEKENQDLAEDSKNLSQIFKDLKTSLNMQNSTNLLHLACQEGLKDQVKMFFEMGAKTNIKSTGG